MTPVQENTNTPHMKRINFRWCVCVREREREYRVSETEREREREYRVSETEREREREWEGQRERVGGTESETEGGEIALVSHACLFHASHISHITYHTSHIAHHTSHITHHTSHITHHTSHITHHTSYITHHTSHIITHHTSYKCGSPFFSTSKTKMHHYKTE